MGNKENMEKEEKVREVKRLVEKLRGIKKDDYIRIEYPNRKTPLYGIVLGKVLLSEVSEKPVEEDREIYIVFIPSQHMVTDIDPMKVRIRLSKRRKK